MALLSTLRHPNITAYKSSCETSKHIVLVMELCVYVYSIDVYPLRSFGVFDRSN